MTTPISSLAGQTRRPRVGIDFHTFDGPGQGRRTHLLGMYREAVRRAPEYDFVFFCARPDLLRAADPAFALAIVKCVAMARRTSLARLGWQLAWLRLRHRIDLLHMQDRLPVLPCGPCVVTLHDTLFETHPQLFTKVLRRLVRLTGRRAVRKAALLVATSEFSRREIARLYGVDPVGITLTANGVDTARFHPASASRGGDQDDAEVLRSFGAAANDYIVCVGRRQPRRNHLALVRAYARLAEPRPPLLVVGQGEGLHDEAVAEVHALGLLHQVKFIEDVADAALPALLRHARVVFHTSRAEGFGLPVLEAMASGVAVITSDAAGMAELSAGAVLAVNPDDPLAITQALERLLYDPMLRRRLAARGLEVAAGRRWDSAAKALVGAYRRFFAGRMVLRADS